MSYEDQGTRQWPTSDKEVPKVNERVEYVAGAGTPSKSPREDKGFELIKMYYWFKTHHPTWGKVHKALETRINNELP